VNNNQTIKQSNKKTIKQKVAIEQQENLQASLNIKQNKSISKRRRKKKGQAFVLFFFFKI